MAPLLEELAGAYKEEREYVSFEIMAVGSQGGLEALERGIAEIALVSRELTPAEKEKWQAELLAWDALAIVVHPNNPIASLSLQEIRDIFTGEILSWEEVGVAEGEIQVLTREEGSGSRASFATLILTEGERMTSWALVLPSDQAVGDYVAQNPLAIGYASLATIPPGVVALSVDGQEATVSGQYPLLRPFFLVTLRNPSAEVRDFLDFCLGPRGQAIVANRYRRVR